MSDGVPSALTVLFQKGYGLFSLKFDSIVNNPSNNVLKVIQVPLSFRYS